jgi:hypothetical protein
MALADASFSMNISSILRGPAALLAQLGIGSQQQDFLSSFLAPAPNGRFDKCDLDVEMGSAMHQSQVPFGGPHIQSTSTLSRLSDDLVVDEVFGYLELKDILRMRMVRI